MKSRHKWGTLVACLAIGTFAATGCGDEEEASSAPSGGSTTASEQAKSYTIGFAVPILQNPTVQATVQGMVSAAEEAGAKLVVKDARLQGNQQISDLDDLANQGVDAVIVWATTDPKTLAPALKRVSDAGIPIFSVDGSGSPDEVTNFQQASKQMGVEAAKLMAELVGSGDIGVIGGVPAPSIIDRVAAFTDTIKNDYPDIKIVEQKDNLKDVAAGAEPLVANMLTQFSSLKGVYTYNDPSAIGAAAAARSAGRDDLVIVGNNADPQGVDAVKDGRVTATVDAMPVELGVKAVEGAIAYLNDDSSTPPEVVTVEPAVVTADNVDEFVPWVERTGTPNYDEVCTGCTQ